MGQMAGQCMKGMAVFTLSVSLLLGGCFEGGQDRAIETELQKLKHQVKMLEIENLDLQQQINDLQNFSDRAGDAVDDLDDRVESLERKAR